MFRWFESLATPFAPYARRTPPDRYWPFMLWNLVPVRGPVAAALALGLVTALVETGLIYYAGRVVDVLSAVEDGPGRAALWAQSGMELAFVAVFVLLLRPLVIWLQMAVLNQGVAINLVSVHYWRAHRHVLGQSVGFFQNDFAGRIASRVMRTAPAAEDSVYSALEAVLYCAAYVIGAGVVLSQADPRLAVPLAIWLAVYIAVLVWLVPKMADASALASSRSSALTGRIVDAYSNIETVKLFAHTEREEEIGREAIEELREADARMMRLMTVMSLSLALAGAVLLVGVVGTAVWLWSAGTASVGAVAAGAALSLRLNSMMGWIMWVTSQLFQNAGIIREGLETIAVPHQIVDRPDAPALEVAGGEIRYEDARHSYGKGPGRGGLEGLDLVVRAGERVGLVGRSGAGKSSMVNLLLRFHELEQGRILIDGQDVQTVTQDSLRTAIGMVTQDTSLLHRSVRDNVMYGRPDATEAEMIEAARRVHAMEFIPELEDPSGRRGWDAHVGERGVKLSGGQRQRIALARVVLKDAPILVLDEATSALDSEAEAAIQETLYGLMEGKTVIAIAHRLSTIARLDRIVVLDGGRIVEDGTHDALLAHGGIYAGLWARQSGGFLGEDAAAAEAAE